MEMELTSTAVIYLLALISISSASIHVAAVSGVEVEYHVMNVTPTVTVGSILSDEIFRCGRAPVHGLSRLKLWSYSCAHRATLVPFNEIPEKSYSKIQICLHSNSSLGLCHCEKEDWESIQNGVWSSVISPYENRYIDVKFSKNLSGSVTVSIKREFHKWRLVCLGIGLILLLLAPIVSGWVPFYYSSSMAIGICLVIIIVLFQGMKLLPTGRKNALYSTICGIALGAGSFLLNRLSVFVNSILVNFGFSEELHNPVLIFLAVGVILAGAGFGYWLVRKFVIDKDGSVDVGAAQFVKWALRIIAVTFLFQSTLDTPLAVGMLLFFLAIYLFVKSMEWDDLWDYKYTRGGNPKQEWSSERIKKKHKNAEFLRSRTKNFRGSLQNRPRSESAWLNSPVKGIVSPSNRRGARNPPTYYSTFHRTPDRKKFSDEDWKQFTEESTRQAVTELTSSPDFTNWIMKNADRIQLRHSDSSEESMGSGSESTDENMAESSSGRGLFRWQQ